MAGIMATTPTLKTARLTLRPFTTSDAPAVERQAGAREVALNTLHVPHPYPPGAALEWISGHQADLDEGRADEFAVDDGEVVGAIGLMMSSTASRRSATGSVCPSGAEAMPRRRRGKWCGTDSRSVRWRGSSRVTSAAIPHPAECAERRPAIRRDAAPPSQKVGRVCRRRVLGILREEWRG